LSTEGAEHTVVLSSFLEDIVPIFMSETEADMKRLMVFAESGDLESIRKIAHVFYGTAGSYGFDEISGYGMAIGDAARVEDIEKTAELIGQLNAYWRGLNVEFKDDDGDDFMC
jgi:HPt (histidine-containing phosphotransfer) domain-containing protein